MSRGRSLLLKFSFYPKPGMAGLGIPNKLNYEETPIYLIE